MTILHNVNLQELMNTGITGDSFLTVTDDDGDNPRVNLILSVKAG